MQCLRSVARGLVVATLVAAGQTAWTADECDAAPESWQPRSAVHALAQRNGWQVDALKVDDGCYEVKGHDADGRRFKAKIDPVTLQVLRVKREHGERARQREGRGAPAASPSPSVSAPFTGSSAPASVLEPG